MKAKSARWYLLGYFVLLMIAMMLHSDETIGINTAWSNGEYSYQIGSAPWSIAFAVVGSGLYVWTALGKASTSSRPLPQVFRRWMAGLMDFALALVTPASFFGFAAVLREYKRTGVFDWIIERHDYQTGDSAFSITSVLAIMFIFLPAYFVISWVLEKPTPGSCVCDFRIVTDNGSPLSPWKAWLRALLGCFALIAWPSWILAYWVKRDKEKGKFWLDQIFKTHAEFLE